MSNHRLQETLKEIMQKIAPDLRPFMLPPVRGIVTAVHEDAFAVDIEIPDKPKEGEEPGDPWIMTEVPVSAVFAGDGFGAYALPEIGAEVNVKFVKDLTDPRIDGAEFMTNRTPLGGRAGSFTIVDNQGQRFSMRSDTGQMILRSYNMDDEASGARSERTIGHADRRVDGDQVEQIGGSVNRTVEVNLTEILSGVLSGKYGYLYTDRDGNKHYALEEKTQHSETIGGTKKDYQHARLVEGAELIKVSGRQDVKISGDKHEQVLQDSKRTVARNVSEIVGGVMDVIVAGAGVPDPNHLATYQCGSPLPTGINVFGGLYQTPFAPAIIGKPMVVGDALATVLNIFLAAMDQAFVDFAASCVGGLSGDAAPLRGYSTVLAGRIKLAVNACIAQLWAGYTPSISPPTPVLARRHFLGGPVF